MSNLSINELESLLLNENREAIYEKMIPKSQNLEYLKIMEQLKNTSASWTSLAEEIIKFENNRNFGHELKNKLKVLRLIKSFEMANDEKAKKEALDKIKKEFFHFSYSYPRPEVVKNLQNENSDLSDNEDSTKGKLKVLEHKMQQIKNFEKNQTLQNFRQVKSLPYLFSLNFDVLQHPKEMKIDLLREILDLINNGTWTINNFKNFKNFFKKLMELDSKNIDQLRRQLMSLMEKLPLSWIEEYKKNKTWLADEQYIAILMTKKLNLNMDNPRTLKLEEIEEIKEFIYSLNSEKFQRMVYSLDLEILNKQSLNNEYNKELFVEYIKNVPAQYVVNDAYIYNDKFRNTKMTTLDRDNKMMQTPFDRNLHNQVVDRFLNHFFKTANNTIEWESYFNIEKLRKMFVEIKLLQGEKPEGFENVLSENQIRNLANRVDFQIKKENKKHFSNNEKVELELLLKNVNEVRVKIFQINQQQTLLDNINTDFAKLDLLGLMAKEDYVYKYDKAPLIQWTQKYTFDSISSAKRGVFIIDFISNGKTARAIITKGNLNLVSEQHKLGTSCIILDEELNICVGKQTGLYINKKFYGTDELGVIYLPNNDTSLNGKAIVCHENFASISQVNVTSPKMDMNIDVMFNSEQLRAGNDIDLIILPKLKMNNNPLPLSELKDVNLKVEFLSETGSPKLFEFNEANNNLIELKEGSFTNVKVTFPPKTLSMNVMLTGHIKMHNTDKIVLNDSVTYYFTHSEERKIEQIYLVHEKERGYVAKTLGMNGEPLKDKELNLEIGLNNPVPNNHRINLTSNKKGESVLGHFDNLERLFVSLDSNYDADSSINKQTNYFYSSQVVLVEGEGILLPIEDANKFCFVQTKLKPDMTFNNNSSASFICEDFTNNKDHVTLKDNMVKVHNLKEGEYLVRVGKDDEEIVSLVVLKGQRIDKHGRNFIKCEDELIHVKTDAQFWRLLKNNNKLKILQGQVLSNNPNLYKPGSIETVLFCNTFINEESTFITRNNIFNSTKGVVKSYKIQKPTSHYLQNKQMSEEILYVMRRRNHDEFIGNTLEKPTMLLKRKKNLTTSNEDERMKNAKAFDEHIMPEKCMAADYFDDPHRQNVYLQEKLNKTIDLSTGFLTQPGTVVSNGFSLDNQNCLQVPEEITKQYNHVVAVFNLNGQVVLTETFKNEYVEPKTMSLTLQNAKIEGNVYRKSRICEPVQTNTDYSLDNIDKTTFRILKSMTDLFSLIGPINSNLESQLQDWKFLTNWNSLTPTEKLMKYDKFISHELNLFCYFKDKEFFENVVKLHIVNKREKDIVDHFLLSNKEQLERYLDSGIFQDSLNMFEQILVLMTFWNDPRAKKLAHGIKLKLTSPSYKVNEDVYKNLFDKIVESKDDEEDIQYPLEEEELENDYCDAYDEGRGMEMEIKMLQRNSMPMTQSFSNVAPRRMMKKKSAVNQMRNIQPMLLQKSAMVYNAPPPPMMMNAEFAMDSNIYTSQSRARNLGYGGNIQVMEQKFKQAAADVYEKLESTTEYIEKKFYFDSNDVTFNVFYSNLLEHVMSNNGSCTNFLDKNFMHCWSSPTEIILLMSLLDIGFNTDKPTQSLSNFCLTLTPKNNCIILSKQVEEVKAEKLNLDFLISQRFYDPQDRYVYQEDGTKTEKPVREFRKGKIYGCRVVVINSSVSEQKVQVITEVPEGSLPIKRAESLEARSLTIGSFKTEIIDFTFYFPHNGTFKIFPATVAKGDKILCVANSNVEFKVGEKVAIDKFETLNDILSSNNLEHILEFLRTKNLQDSTDYNFSKIGWLLNNEDVYKKIIEIYENRGLFEYNLWGFAFKYGDHQRAMKLMKKSMNLIPFSFFNICNLNKDEWQTKDYFPLVNPRAHSISDRKSNILNKEFKNTYQNCLKYLLEKSFFTELNGDDYLLLVSYMLLQDRVAEANTLFNKQQSLISQTTNVIQKDYIEAYIDFMIGYPDFTRSKEICQNYLSYPVMTWRNRFVEIANQLAEYENIDFENEDKEKKTKTKFDQAENAPHLEAEIENESVKCSFKNINNIYLEYYMIDLEVLFSQDPFEKSLNDSLTKVLPFFVDTVKVEKSHNYLSQNVKIPENLKNENLLIRVTEDSQQSTLLKYIPFNLKVNLNERYGVLKLMIGENNKPVPKVYVKCFCKNSSNIIKFYKDGYTDLRGSFDFASVNSNNASAAEEFKLLVISKEFGSKIFTAKPPTSSLKKEGEAKKIQSKNWRMMSSKNAKPNLYCQAVANL